MIELTIGKPVFWIVDILVIVLFLFCLAFGYEHGAGRMLADIGKAVLQIGITLSGTYWLTKHCSLFSESGFYEYVEFKWRQRAPLGMELSHTEVNKLRVLMTGVIWFFLVLLAVELVIGIVRHLWHKKTKKKEEKKKIGKYDHLAGELLGALLFIIWASLPAPLLITAEKINFFTNGTDFVNKTVLTVPVNYAVKPVLRLIAPDSAAAKAYEEGIEALPGVSAAFEQWLQENSESQAE